jgi:2-dehydropantoate 2-reductase
MRIAVIGAGAVGGTFAALLSAAGHDVQVTARGEQLAAIRAGGIHLVGAFGNHHASVGASELLTETFELVVVATKAQDAAAALTANALVLGGTPVLVIQNGLESLATAHTLLSRSHVIGGLALFAASFLKPGEIEVTTGGTLVIGGGPAEATALVAEVLGAVMPVTVSRNFVGAQWTKLVVNHVNALPAITGLPVQEVIAQRPLRLALTESIREAVRVAAASKIRFEKMQGLSNAALHTFARLPARTGQALPLLMARRMGNTPNPGSTLQSIRRGQPTEIDYLNGAVVKQGLAVGVPTPVSAALVEMVHEVEQTGSFLTPAAVMRRLTDEPA